MTDSESLGLSHLTSSSCSWRTWLGCQRMEGRDSEPKGLDGYVTLSLRTRISSIAMLEAELGRNPGKSPPQQQVTTDGSLDGVHHQSCSAQGDIRRKRIQRVKFERTIPVPQAGRSLSVSQLYVSRIEKRTTYLDPSLKCKSTWFWKAPSRPCPNLTAGNCGYWRRGQINGTV